MKTTEHKAGDIINIFGNPIKLTSPIGQARLVSKISEHECLEHWNVEFLNDEGHTYPQFIRKDNGKRK